MTDTTTTGSEQIGSVVSLNGSVWAVDGDSQRPLENGSPVYEGEEIVTESGSNVEIKFADNTILGQGEDSAVRLDDYVFTEEDNSLDFHMLKGVMRIVSGEIVKANPEGFNLSTPLATIGIRGTEVMIQVDNGREIIGVDQLGEGHTVLIKNAFNEVVIDRAGMFSGVDFDGSLIAPDEMPDTFIESMVKAAPLTLMGDEARSFGDPQDIVPPQFYETIDNQTGEYQPGVGMQYADDSFASDDEEEFDEEFELSEEDLEAMLDLETAAGGDEGTGNAEELGEVVDVEYDPHQAQLDASGEGGTFGGIPPAGSEGTTGGENTTTTTGEGTTDGIAPVAEDIQVLQGTAGENEPVTFQVIGEGVDATLVDASLTEGSDQDGSVEYTPDGSITFTPEPGDEGTVFIEYTLQDADGDTSTGQISVELAEDSEPVAQDDFGIEQDASGEVITFNVFEDGAVDTGADDAELIDAWVESDEGQPQTLSLLSNDQGEDSTGGTLTFSADGTITYTPGHDEEGTVSINYVVQDEDGDQVQGQLSIDLADHVPIIEAESEDAESGEGVITASGEINVDFGADDEETSIELASDNTDAQWNEETGTLEGDGWSIELTDEGYEFTQDASLYQQTQTEAGEEFTIDVTVTATDSDGSQGTGQFSITLTDDGPIAENVDLITQEVENTDVSFNVFDYGETTTGVFGGTVSASVVEGDGDVSYNDDGTITYTPAEGEEGTVTLSYTLTDNDGDEATGSATIELAADSAPEITVEDTTSSESDGLVTTSDTFDVDFGADSDGTTIELTADGATWDGESQTLTADDESWSVELTDEGYQFNQLAAFDHSEGDSVAINISVTATDGDGTVTEGAFSVTVDDSGPTATNASATGTTEDASISYNVISSGAASLGIDGGTLTGAALSEGSDYGGDVSFSTDGTVTYTPIQGETGTVDVIYTVTDSDGDTATAQVSFDLAGDSEPTITVTDASGSEADGLVTETGSLDIDYGADVDGSSIELSATDATWDSESQTLTADDNSWKVELTESGYEFTQLAAFEHVDGDSIVLDVDVTAADGDGSITIDSFSVTVDDAAPTAADASATAETEDASVSYNVITGEEADLGTDGGSLTYAGLPEDSGYGGAVSFTADGNITYAPAQGETGTVVIDYTVTDNDGDSASAQVSFNLAADSAPTITTSDVSGDEGDGLVSASGTLGVDFGADASGASVTLSATDATWDSESRMLVANDESWSIEVTDSGYQFNQLAAFDHTDSDSYVIDVGVNATDGDGTVTEGSFSVTVDDADPSAANASIEQENVGDTINYNVFTEGDAVGGTDGATLVLAWIDSDDYTGELTYTADGNITYVPGEGEDGTVPIQYLVEDTDGDQAEAQLNVALAEIEESQPGEEIDGGRGTDLLIGTDGDDTIDGGQGYDIIYGAGGDDLITGGQDADLLIGSSGEDTIDGGQGRDIVYGGSDSDVLYGGQDSDFMFGGDGDDTIIGEQGDDRITGGAGDDLLTGSQGDDTFVLNASHDGIDTIEDFKSGEDSFLLKNFESLTVDDDGNLSANQFATVSTSIFEGGYDFEGSSSGVIYASEDGSTTGTLYYDPDDTTDGDEIVLAEVNEDSNNGDDNITHTDIGVV